MRKTVNETENQKNLWKRYKSLWMLLIKLVSVILVVWLSLLLVVGIFPVHGNNMYPMLKDGDLAITLRTGGYERGQVVAYKAGGEVRFARIVAVSGDTVSIDEDYTINGQHPYEEVFYPTSNEVPVETVVNENQVFLLNDFRENKSDSRTCGAVSVNQLEGHVIFLFRWRSL